MRRCAPDTLRVLVALLLSPRELERLLGTRPPQCSDGRTVDLALRRTAGDPAFAARLATRLAARAAARRDLLARSPYDILALWGARTAPLPRRAVGSMLWRLAGDPALAPLAARLARDVRLAGARRARWRRLPPPA